MQAHPRTLRLPGVTTFAVGCAFLVAVPGVVFAQANEPDNTKVLPRVRVEADAIDAYGVEATSTATKTETPLRDVPQSITVITRNLIDDQDMRTMADVVRYVPGVSMGQGEGHRDAPTLRGNGSTADFFVDGVRDDVQYFRDLYNADRIEALKGPNAMIFGRGGGGGLINRVTKQADGEHHGEVTLQGGSNDNKRITADAGEGLTDRFAARLSAMYEDSDSYRDYFNVERLGFNPTALITISDDTRIRASYEYFDDQRTVDRGVPSRAGRPVDVDDSTFFGNPDLSYSDMRVNLATLSVEHDFSPTLRLRNHTVYGDHDKFYQNVYPNSAASAAGNVTLDAYNSGTERQNFFNQTDLTWRVSTGSLEHTVLAGIEIGRQDTDNFRFNSVGGAAGTVSLANPVTFTSPGTLFTVPNQNNHSDVSVAALYVQDQIALSDKLQLIAGLRFDRFEQEFENNLNGARFSRDDDLTSPRAGLIFKPLEAMSLYASYGISYLPSSGDQFASLDATSAALEPEEFENLEVGFKWDVRPNLAVTAAVYQLDRTNTRAAGPTPGTVVLTGSQRSEGVELGVSGALTDKWQFIAGYAYQNAKITSTTAAAPEGREVALVPEHQISLWNKYQLTPMWGIGLGVTHQSEVFTSFSNAATLPDFTRVDAAVFFHLNERFEARLNAENILDEEYWGTAHNDNNITPGSPFAVKASLAFRF
jgi:catecholate siderophore receptor